MQPHLLKLVTCSTVSGFFLPPCAIHVVTDTEDTMLVMGVYVRVLDFCLALLLPSAQLLSPPLHTVTSHTIPTHTLPSLTPHLPHHPSSHALHSSSLSQPSPSHPSLPHSCSPPLPIPHSLTLALLTFPPSLPHSCSPPLPIPHSLTLALLTFPPSLPHSCSPHLPTPHSLTLPLLTFPPLTPSLQVPVSTGDQLLLQCELGLPGACSGPLRSVLHCSAVQCLLCSG